MTTREVTWTAEGLTRGLREATGDESIEVSIWAANVIAVRMDWPATSSAFARVTRGLRRELKRGAFRECYFAPDPSQVGALVVFDRSGAWKREADNWGQKGAKPCGSKSDGSVTSG